MVIDKNDVKKLNIFYRVLCMILFMLSIILILSSFLMAFKGSYLAGLVSFFISTLMLYVCTPIAFKGYPPKFLYWTMNKNDF